MISVDYEQVVYNGNGSQTAWPYSFPIYDGDVVRLILLDADGTETYITQDYYVDVPGSTVYYPGYAAGAEPPEADQPPKVQPGQKLIVYRDTEITQDSDLGDSWPFNVIEKGLDKLTMILQEKAFALARCLKISQGQAAEIDDYDTTVPLAADKVICGNANGNGFEAREAMMEVNGAWDGEGRQIHSVADPTADQDAVTKKYADTRMDNNFMKMQPDGTAWEGRNLPISNVAGPALVKDAANKDYVDRILAGYSGYGERLAIFDNVAQMQAAELVPSQVAVTLGYWDVNDGGAGVYTIRDKGADTPDGGSIIEITGTDYVAELNIGDGVNICQFGVKAGDSDNDTMTSNTTQFNALVALGEKITIPAGEFYFNGRIDLTTSPHDSHNITGAGESSILHFVGASAGLYEAHTAADGRNFHTKYIGNMWLDGDETNVGFECKALDLLAESITFTHFAKGLYCNGACHNTEFKNVHFSHNIIGTEIGNLVTTFTIENGNWDHHYDTSGAAILFSGDISTVRIQGIVEGNPTVAVKYGENFKSGASTVLSLYFEANGTADLPQIQNNSNYKNLVTYRNCYFTSNAGYSYLFQLGSVAILEDCSLAASYFEADKIIYGNNTIQGAGVIMPDTICISEGNQLISDTIGVSGTDGGVFQLPCTLSEFKTKALNNHPDPWSTSGASVGSSYGSATQDTSEKLFNNNTTKVECPAMPANQQICYLKPPMGSVTIPANSNIVVSFYAKASEEITIRFGISGNYLQQIRSSFKLDTTWKKFMFINSKENTDRTAIPGFGTTVDIDHSFTIHLAGISVVTPVTYEEINKYLKGFADYTI